MGRAGLFRNRVTIQSAINSTDSFGEKNQTWTSTAVGTLWAQVDTEKGREGFQSGAERTIAPTVFRIRYRSDVDTSYRVLWPSTSEIYDIESVQNVDGKDYLLEIWGVKRG